MHNETPIEDPVTHMTRALQLWVALPEANLRDEPGYKDVLSSTCPIATPSPGVSVKIIAGSSFGAEAPILTRAPVWYLDITMQPDTTLSHPVPHGWNVFVIVLGGKPSVAGKECVPHETTFFEKEGEVVELANQGKENARIIFIAGDPLTGQEVHRYGPFVSTSKAGISKALMDYRMVSLLFWKGILMDTNAWGSQLMGLRIMIGRVRGFITNERSCGGKQHKMLVLFA